MTHNVQSDSRGPAFRQFDDIAFLYDELMKGVPYGAWVDYVQRVAARFRRSPRWVLDLCCGTGSVSLILARKGYRVVGVDISEAMIDVARAKAAKTGLQIEFRGQDASKLSLPHRFDLIISLFDSLNYITDPAALQETFDRVAEHMRPGALFVFDLNTELALAGGYFDQDDAGIFQPVRYVWRSSYDHESRICRIEMVFNYSIGGSKGKVEVAHLQRAYDQDEVAEMLTRSGLAVLGIYDAYSFKPASKRSDRVFFAAGS